LPFIVGILNAFCDENHADVIVCKISEQPTLGSFQSLFRIFARVRSGISRNGISQESHTTAIDAFRTYVADVPSSLRNLDTTALAVTVKALLSFRTDSGECDQEPFSTFLFKV
jgi:hypothetical protein